MPLQSVNLVKVNAAESFEDELNHASVNTDDELDVLAANALRRTALVRTRTLEQTASNITAYSFATYDHISMCYTCIFTAFICMPSSTRLLIKGTRLLSLSMNNIYTYIYILCILSQLFTYMCIINY